MEYPDGSYCESLVIDKSEPSVTDRLIINVGGMKHECYISTIQNFPDTRLYWIAETALKMADFDPEANEFFFDRHPGCFQNILNYCRTGKLHCPNDVCGPLFEEELRFWGIDELMMEPCCWGNYTQHREAKETLKLFDEIYQDDKDHVWLYETQFTGLSQRFKHIQRCVWITLEKPGKTLFSQTLTVFIMAVTLLSIVTFCLETEKELKRYTGLFKRLEIFYCLFFTTDFLTRFLCCPSKLKFAMSALAWIDFLSTVQFYISIFSRTDVVGFLFTLRLLRIFRLLHFFKNFAGVLVIAQTLKSSARELLMLVVILCFPTVTFATLVYYAEQDEGAFSSIPKSFWWAIITLTTVGYGDQVPSSGWGKLLGAICAFSGILIVALPISVIGNNFNFYYTYAQARMRLPKRQYHVMISADKGLTSTDDSSSDTSYDEESRLRKTNSYRRSAIQPSAAPVIRSTSKKFRQKLDVKNIKKLSRKNADGVQSSTLLDQHVKTERSRTFNGEPSSFLMNPLMKLQSVSCERLSCEMYNIKGKSEKRKVVHLDISSYEPSKLNATAMAFRRKTSRYNSPFRNLTTNGTEETVTIETTNKKKRKISVIKKNDKDVLMWMEGGE